MSERVRIVSTSHRYGVGEVTFGGIPEELVDKVEGVSYGQYWMTVSDGSLVFKRTREKLPDPAADEEMLPFWRRRSDTESHLQEVLFDKECIGHSSPSIYIGSLCGYDYTPEDYRENASRLESYGFVCMRSQRGDDGKFWETWFLPLFLAQGALKETLEAIPQKSGEDPSEKRRTSLDRAVSFLCRSVSFGTLDVVVQRAAAVID
jgi:hypothetical protein